MAQKTQMVTIPLEEYKELLLKDKPKSSDDSVLLERFMAMVEEGLEYSDSSYYNGYINDNMQVKDDKKIVVEFMRMLRYVDFERYMNIWNKVQTAHRKDEEMKAKIEQMNKAKELRQEQE